MRVAYEVATADMSGPVLNRPALKKYGDVLPSAYSQMKEPNFNAPVASAPSINSRWWF